MNMPANSAYLQHLAKELERLHVLPQVPACLAVTSQTYTGISFEIEKLQAGDLWVNLHGNTAEAKTLLQLAAGKGAAATIAEFPTVDPTATAAVPHFRVTDVRRVISVASAILFTRTSQRVQAIGVTGTVGKTTTTCMVARCLDFAQIRHGLATSAVWRTGDEVRPESVLTTADAPDLHKHLANMDAAMAKYAVLEVSSQALVHQRVEDVGFAGALITNLGRDHEEFHGSFDHYMQAKSRLFQGLGSDHFAIHNMDSAWCRAVATATRASQFTYGLSTAADVHADPHTGQWHLSSRFREHFSLARDAELPRLSLMVPGVHNFSNAIGAAALSLALGCPAASVAAALNSFPGLPGRGQFLLQRPIEIFYDVFERTALNNAIPILAAQDTRKPCVVVIAPRANRTPEEYQTTSTTFLKLIKHHKLNIRHLILSRGRRSNSNEPAVPANDWEALLTRMKQASQTPILADSFAPALEKAATHLRSGHRLLIFGERAENPLEMIHTHLTQRNPDWYNPAKWMETSTLAHLRQAILQHP